MLYKYPTRFDMCDMLSKAFIPGKVWKWLFVGQTWDAARPHASILPESFTLMRLVSPQANVSKIFKMLANVSAVVSTDSGGPRLACHMQKWILLDTMDTLVHTAFGYCWILSGYYCIVMGTTCDCCWILLDTTRYYSWILLDIAFGFCVGYYS